MPFFSTHSRLIEAPRQNCENAIVDNFSSLLIGYMRRNRAPKDKGGTSRPPLYLKFGRACIVATVHAHIVVIIHACTILEKHVCNIVRIHAFTGATAHSPTLAMMHAFSIGHVHA